MDTRHAKLGVRVQKIGIIDLFLTACLFAELLPKAVTLLQKYIVHLYQTYLQTQPNKETSQITNLLNSHVGASITVEDDLTDNSVYSEPLDKPNLTFWWVLKDVFFVGGLLVVFLQALGLIRATNLQILNTPKAARLARNWLLSNILVVLIITLLIILNLPDYPGGEGMEVAIVGCAVYLFGRGVASYSVWKFMKEVNNTVAGGRAITNGTIVGNVTANGNVILLPNTTG